jgi:hypothetical protein
MKLSDEKRLGETILTALVRVRLFMCRVGTAGQWHMQKAESVIRKPRLLERLAPHLEGAAAKLYIAALPNLVEETKLLDFVCGDMWNRRRSDYVVERDRLVALLLRYDFSFRTYEKLARQTSKQVVASGPSHDDAPPHDEIAARMTEQETIDMEGQLGKELQAIDDARAELVAAHDDLVEKIVQKSAAPEEITPYARYGLAKAAENFDVRRGHRFATYARLWINTAIKEKKTWEK